MVDCVDATMTTNLGHAEFGHFHRLSLLIYAYVDFEVPHLLVDCLSLQVHIMHFLLLLFRVIQILPFDLNNRLFNLLLIYNLQVHNKLNNWYSRSLDELHLENLSSLFEVFKIVIKSLHYAQELRSS